MITLEQIKNSIIKADTISVICHVSPDCDTVGAGLALTEFLKKFGKSRVDLYCEDKYDIEIDDDDIKNFITVGDVADYLAKNIPGISSLVDQSNAEMEGSISNGVIRASKILVSGDVFTITGSGTYSMPEDKLDITARVRIFKNNSIIGRLANPITWTFSKLLMEFKVYGSIDDPKWEYVSVIERLL